MPQILYAIWVAVDVVINNNCHGAQKSLLLWYIRYLIFQFHSTGEIISKIFVMFVFQLDIYPLNSNLPDRIPPITGILLLYGVLPSVFNDINFGVE